MCCVVVIVRFVLFSNAVPAFSGAGVQWIGKDVNHVMAAYHVTGEASYVDDIPAPANTLHLALVTSERPHAGIASVDYSAASKLAGFAGWLDHRDVPAGKHGNTVGEVVTDEQLFAVDTVPYVGQVIGCVLAETHEQAKAIARAVKVTYKDLHTPAVLSIEDAIQHNSFLGPTHVLSSSGPAAASAAHGAAGNTDQKRTDSDLAKAFNACDHVVSGEAKMGGQEHFYLETNACLVVPHERDTHIYVSSQNPAKNQEWAAHVLGVPSHRVHVHVKRMGGGFGGKETRTTNFSCFAAIAAHKYKVRQTHSALDPLSSSASPLLRHLFSDFLCCVLVAPVSASGSYQHRT